MLRLIAGLPIVVMTALPGHADTAEPFGDPVKDCRPCRLSPSHDQPELELTFVFKGSGDQKMLTALDVTPVGGGQTQRLEIQPRDAENSSVYAADFPDGFMLDTSDINFDNIGDLSITTQLAANDANALYWVYQPESRSFVQLERVNDDGIDNLLAVLPDHRLASHVHDSAIEYTDYFYQVAGHRAVAVSRVVQEIDGSHIVRLSYDLTAEKRAVQRTVVGFSPEASASSARETFVRELDAAAARAEKLYRGGDAAGAGDAIAAVVKDMQLAFVTSAYPVDGDPGDLKLARHFNDYGFYLDRAGKTQQAIDVLSQVTDVDPDRTVAYLNLADAQYSAGQTADAKANYAEYRERMVAAGKQAKIPSRVAERLR